MYHFCTYFDSNFLVRGLALYESLVAHVDDFRLYVLCFDDEAYAFLKQRRHARIVPISQEEFEAGDDDLVGCKASRSRIEYFFTCTPSLPLYILDNYNGIDLITYLDADLFFFSSPQPIFQEFSEHSILIIGHRFSDNNKYFERFGKYNVGFLSFRNDEFGRKCLEWWRNKCIEWCFDREEDGRFADQKYLDDWPERFEKVCDLRYKGANLAPWNIDNYKINKQDAYVYVDEDRLVFFHFNGLNKLSWAFYDTGTKLYYWKLSRILIDNVYKPYIRMVEFVGSYCRIKIGFNRFYQYKSSVCNLLRISEFKEVVFFQRYFISFSLSSLLRPLFAIKRKIKMLTFMLLAGS
jgi:hypothetical protein